MIVDRHYLLRQLHAPRPFFIRASYCIEVRRVQAGVCYQQVRKNKSGVNYIFQCELALLVALQGESIWKGGGDVHWRDATRMWAAVSQALGNPAKT